MFRLLFMLGAVAISSSALQAQNAQPPPAKKASYPVEYSSRLGLSPASEINERLQAAFTEGTAHPPGVNSCAQLLAKCRPTPQEACEGQSSSLSDREFQALKSTLADCLVLQELQQAKAATSSHVAKLKWNEQVLPLLPPQLAINVSADAVRKAEAAAAKGQSWPDFDKSATASADGEDQIVVQGEGFMERLILWGRGDLNGDGMEDLLVQSLDTLTQGTYRNTRLFILTRKTADGKLSVVRMLL